MRANVAFLMCRIVKAHPTDGLSSSARADFVISIKVPMVLSAFGCQRRRIFFQAPVRSARVPRYSERHMRCLRLWFLSLVALGCLGCGDPVFPTTPSAVPSFYTTPVPPAVLITKPPALSPCVDRPNNGYYCAR